MKEDITLYQTLNNQTLIDMIGDDRDMILELRSDYMEQVKTSTHKLITSLKSTDYAGLKSEAHFLKTSSKAIGAERTGAILQNLEYAALEENYEDAVKLMKLLRDELLAFKDVIANE